MNGKLKLWLDTLVEAAKRGPSELGMFLLLGWIFVLTAHEPTEEKKGEDDET